MNALNRGAISERADGKCYSYEWVMDNIARKPRKLLEATPFLMVSITFLLAVFYHLIGPQILASIISLGYVLVVALIGFAILLKTDTFEAYGYSEAVHKVETQQLDKEDQSYIELAKEALEKGTMRFLVLGVAFALVGPVLPLLVNITFFQATEATIRVFQVFGIVALFALPIIMLFLPELLSRIIIHNGKLLARKLFKSK